MKYQAVIWDCDGVLIDSEVLSCSAAAEALTGIGYAISLENYLLRFMGKSDRQMFDEIQAETGQDLRANYDPEDLRQKQKIAFTKHLKETPGIRDVLDHLTLPVAITSGSSRTRLAHTLGLTNLDSYFGEHVYSAEMVQNGKPAPDVFLLAAEKLGVDPRACLVIEDSIHGVHGARAAGMDVCAYTGGSHITEKLERNLRDAGVVAVFEEIGELLPFLQITKKLAFSA